MSKAFFTFAVTIVAASLATPAEAALVTLHHWRMGESATAGTDAVGGLNLTTTGSTTGVAGAVTGSTVAQDFVNGVNDGTGESTAVNFLDDAGAGAPTTPTNWGVEMWVNPDLLPDGTNQFEVGLVHIGGTSGGLALELGSHPTWADGTVNWMVHRTGVGATNHNVASGGVTAPTVGTWTHIAYVSEGASATFYVDGVASSIVPNAGTTGTGDPDMTIGSMWSNNRRGFDGQLDEVRIFTFADGEFDINDTFLNRAIPEPSTMVLASLLALAGLVVCKRRK